jgi:hypothetical protein
VQPRGNAYLTAGNQCMNHTKNRNDNFGAIKFFRPALCCFLAIADLDRRPIPLDKLADHKHPVVIPDSWVIYAMLPNVTR